MSQNMSSAPVVAVVNIGTAIQPKHRLTVDGTIVGRGSERDLEPLRQELLGSAEKAVAIRDIFRELRAGELDPALAPPEPWQDERGKTSVASGTIYERLGP